MGLEIKKRITMLGILAIIGLVGLSSEDALALLDIEVIGGQRTGKIVMPDLVGDSETTATIKSSEMALGLNMTFPILPMAFGILAESSNYDLNDATVAMYDDLFKAVVSQPAQRDLYTQRSASGSQKGLMYGPQIKAWIPMGFFKPHLRVSYLMGSQVLSQKAGSDSKPDVSPVTTMSFSSEMTFTTKITEIGLGFTLSLFPLTYLLVEYNVGTLSSELDKAAVQYDIVQGTRSNKITISQEDLTKKTDKMSTRAIRVGLGLSL